MGAPKLPIFDVVRGLRNLTVGLTLTAYIFRTKHDKSKLNRDSRKQTALTKCGKNWGYPSPKMRSQLYTFVRFLTTSRLSVEYLRKQQPTNNWERRWNCDGSSTLSQNFMNFGPQTTKNGTVTLRKCHLLLLCTEVTEQNSTNLCDMLKSEPDLQTHVKNWRGSLPKKLELKLLIL